MPDKARRFGLKALNRALERVPGETAVHLCFGYAAMVANRPGEYQFLTELVDTPAECISIETAQASLDCSVLAKMTGKNIILGVLDLGTNEVETPEKVAARIRRALPYISADRLIIAPDCGMKYLPRDVASGKLKAMVAGAALVRAEVGGRQFASQTV
jgi:5-methyltetrahydropteroyltriglutamate--homocysteine methyltransferase